MKVFEIVEGLDNPITGEKQRWADKNGRDINPSQAKKDIVAAKQSTSGRKYPQYIYDWAKALRAHLATLGIVNVTFKEEPKNIVAFGGTERLATYELDYREVQYTNPMYKPPEAVVNKEVQASS